MANQHWERRLQARGHYIATTIRGSLISALCTFDGRILVNPSKGPVDDTEHRRRVKPYWINVSVPVVIAKHAVQPNQEITHRLALGLRDQTDKDPFPSEGRIDEVSTIKVRREAQLSYQPLL